LIFVLDTNILSAMMSARPSPEVAAWIAGQPEDALFTTTICQAEILAGLAVMPEGRRRVALETAARAIFADDFNGRVLPFDAAVAAAYADIFAARRSAGRPTAPLDVFNPSDGYAPMADRLDFEIDVELETGLITGHAGVPGLIEAFRQTGTAAVIDREIKLKSRKRGLSASEMAASLLAMWRPAASGPRISTSSSGQGAGAAVGP